MPQRLLRLLDAGSNCRDALNAFCRLPGFEGTTYGRLVREFDEAKAAYYAKTDDIRLDFATGEAAEFEPCEDGE